MIIGLGEHQMTHGLRHETKFPVAEILKCTRKDRIGAAHVFDVFSRPIDRRQRIEIGGIGIIPAEIFLIDRLHVMPDMTVIATRMPGTFEARRQLDYFCNLGGREPMVHQADGLIMREFIEIALLADHRIDALNAPDRPMVLTAHRISLAAPYLQRLAQIFRPGERIAHVGATERKQLWKLCVQFSARLSSL